MVFKVQTLLSRSLGYEKLRTMIGEGSKPMREVGDLLVRYHSQERCKPRVRWGPSGEKSQLEKVPARLKGKIYK